MLSAAAVCSYCLINTTQIYAVFINSISLWATEHFLHHFQEYKKHQIKSIKSDDY